MVFFNGPVPQEQDSYILILSSPNLLQRLSRSQICFMDGTFKKCPKPFKQLYMVHAYVASHPIPCVFAAMTHKTAASYKFLLRKIKEIIAGRGDHQWAPNQVMTDFEAAISNAIGSELAGTVHTGCYFHFTQALFRRILSDGLKRRFCIDNNFKMNYYLKCAMAFLPQELVSLADESVNRLFPGDANFNNYFSRNWVLNTMPWNLFFSATTGLIMSVRLIILG